MAVVYLRIEMKFKEYAEVKEIFIYNLFALCDENSMSANYISEKTGVNLNNLGKYRYKGKSISEDKIFDMAKTLKLPIEKIFIAKKHESSAGNP